MKKDIALINYLNSIIDSYINKFISMGYDEAEFSTIIYKFLVDENVDFSEFDQDYYNIEEFKSYDKKELIRSYICAVYYMMQCWDDNTNENYFCDILVNNKIDDPFIEQNFNDENVGIELVDTFLTYLEFMPARKKRLVEKFRNDSNFEEVMDNNEMTRILYRVNKRLEVTEEEYVIDDFIEIYDLISSDSLEKGKNLEPKFIFQKMKSYVFLTYLIKDLNSLGKIPYIKKVFSIMIQNIYSEIHYSKINGIRTLTKLDDVFYELIDSNEYTIEQLFKKYINDDNFSNYLIKNFYLLNLDNDLFDLSNRNTVLCNDGKDEKLKKYTIK